MHGLDKRRFADGEHTALGLTVVAAVLVVVALFLLSVRRLRMMDSPLREGTPGGAHHDMDIPRSPLASRLLGTAEATPPPERSRMVREGEGPGERGVPRDLERFSRGVGG